MREAPHDLTRGATPVPPPLMAAHGLRFDARGQRLIDGIDLTVAQGRRTVILGPNGAGKSLLLRLLHGLVAPAAGEVLWSGRPLDRAARARQAMVFQRPVLLRRSVAANMRFALRCAGVPWRDRAQAVDAALSAAGLSHIATRPARLLSGGEQQRLAIARALAAKPMLLFLDEPTAHLDPASTAAVERMLHAASASGVTLVMVTHDAGQARRIGQDAVFVQNGRVAEVAPVARLLAAPRSAAAQAWTEGRLPMLPPEAV
jgi:tungstate transport system ATP-binding protein